MTGYKAFEKDLSCRNFQYEIGKTYEIDGSIGLCKKGFHFCRYPSQVFRYYDKREEPRICVVKADREVIVDEDKCVCSKITIIGEITGINRGRINHGYGSGNGDGSRYGHGKGDGYGYGDGRGYGEGYGYGYGNGYGYDTGNGCGDGDGDSNGNGYGNEYGKIDKVLIFKEG